MVPFVQYIAHQEESKGMFLAVQTREPHLTQRQPPGVPTTGNSQTKAKIALRDGKSDTSYGTFPE